MNIRFPEIANKIIEYGIIFLIIFTPLAFGTVHPWAYTLMELTVCFLVIIWIVRLWMINIYKTTGFLGRQSTISNPKPFGTDITLNSDFLDPFSEEYVLQDPDICISNDTSPGRTPNSYIPHFTVNRFGFVKTPLNISILLFVGLVLFQLTPLPSGVLKLLSPNTYQLYQTTSLDKTSQGLSLFTDEVKRSRRIGTVPTGTGGLQITNDKSTINNQQSSILGSKSSIVNRKSSIYNCRPLSIYPYATKTELFKILAYIGMFLLIINTPGIRTERLIFIIISVGCLVSLLGILQKLSGTTNVYWIRDASYATHFGTYINRNHFAGYIGMVIPMCFGMLIARVTNFALYNKMTWRTMMVEFETHLVANFILVFILMVMISAQFLSLSRGGIISFFVTFMAFSGFVSIGRVKTSFHKGKTVVFSVIIFTLGFLMWLGLSPILNRLSNLSSPVRYEVLQNTIDMIKDFPLFGTGLGTFQHLYPKYKTVQGQLYYDHAHNDYIELLSDIGLFGFMIVLVGLIAFFWKVLLRWWERRDPYIKGVVLGGLCGTISILIHSLTDFNLHIPANAMLLSIILGLTYNIVNLESIRVRKE